MLKHSETIINAKVRRQDGTWDYHSNHWNSTDTDTIFERPDLTTAAGLEGKDTWYFNGDASELRQFDSNTWDPNHPVFEYEVQENIEDNPDPDKPGYPNNGHAPDPDGETGHGPTEHTDDWARPGFQAYRSFRDGRFRGFPVEPPPSQRASSPAVA